MGCCNANVKKTILIIGDYYSFALSNKFISNEEIIIANNNSKMVVEEMETFPTESRNKNITLLPLNLRSNTSIFKFLNLIKKYKLDVIINTPSYKGEYSLSEDLIESHLHENNISILIINLYLIDNLNTDGRIINLIQNNYKSNNYTIENIRELHSTIHFQTIIGMDNHPYFGNSMLGIIFISKFLEKINQINGNKVVLVEKTSIGCEETLTECIYHTIENGQYWKEKKISVYPDINEDIMKEFIDYCWVHLGSLINQDSRIISSIIKFK
jgi:hypothetical protein